MAKKELEEEHENHERWLVSYADMITLLMVLFVVLFSMATVDATKFNALKDSLAGIKTPSPSVLSGQQTVVDGGVPQLLDTTAENPAPDSQTPDTPTVIDANQAKKALQEQQAKDAAKSQEAQNLEEVKQEIQASLAAHGESDAVQFTKDSRGLTITIVTDKVLFDVGQANIKPQAHGILDALGPALAAVPNDLAVEGYTDNSPIHTGQFDSNWELSTARATSVLRYLVEQENVAASRVGATGYGEQRAAVPNDSDSHRSQNRRVEVVVLSTIQN